ncbi:hypothetical protein E1B28_002025 [Marasmius oreades]|uniref:Protein-S-isoprenylcysteine O-methyltransferase n=1 Tax=Marasmius oreades TaxID=181124 RepID=A0A9P7V4P5_9AGAR|nr:uncharacterized protein E1B28_002025 [Marasmius oreades]KAG7100253.1 hypothetical protein E1B28_002025 [Marasmius oreades]
MDIILTLETMTRLILLFLSVYLFHRTYSPPVGNFKIPALGPSFSEKREWLLLWLARYVYPSVKTAYMTVTFLECLFIIVTHYFDNPSRIFLAEYLPFPIKTPQPSPSYVATFGLLTGITGGLLRISSYKALGDAFTFNLTQTSPKLITTGPYSLVRHPSYLGMSLTSIGVSVYHLSPGSWLRESSILQSSLWKIAVGLWILMTVFAPNISLALRADDEDQLMKRMFGKEWEAWRKVVRYKIYPGLY